MQCTSSPSKNVFKDVVDQIIRKVGNLQQAAEVPMERLAWKNGIDAVGADPGGRAHLAGPPLAAAQEAGAGADVSVAAGLEAAGRRRQASRTGAGGSRPSSTT